jgi:hypothetical protein
MWIRTRRKGTIGMTSNRETIRPHCTPRLAAQLKDKATFVRLVDGLARESFDA